MMKRKNSILNLLSALILTAGIFSGCNSADAPPMVNLGIDDQYYIPRMTKLLLQPALTGKEYRWKVNGEVVSVDKDMIFISQTEGA